MKSLLLIVVSLFLSDLCAQTIPTKQIISVDEDALKVIQQNFSNKSFSTFKSNGHFTLIEINADEIDKVSSLLHDKLNRCGGFIHHDSVEEFYSSSEMLMAPTFNFNFSYPAPKKEVEVATAIAEVDARKITNTISKLANFKNRYYKSEHGVNSQKWLKSRWETLASARSDIEVKEFVHSWKQPSIIMTIKGTSDKHIVIGGHGDSIAGWFSKANARAPGADDNASGIATITEIIRVLIKTGFRPTNNIHFMSYAAEEVGLRGSKEIAQKFKRDNKEVIGVLQLDMTNFNGSEQDIVMMSDFTDASQNQFLGTLLDKYFKNLKWGYDRCGYACSDHASWTSQGYPASMPFEAKKGNMNRHIHTSKDTLSRSEGHSRHAAKFARLGLSYVLELDE